MTLGVLTVGISKVFRVQNLHGARAFAATVWRNRALISELVSRDIKGDHARHGLGAIWVYVQPLVVVGTFMLVFGVVLGSRLAITQTFPGDYTSYILVGMVPWLFMQGALGRGPAVFLSNANLVKQVVFPVEVLPIASIVACLLTFGPAYFLMLFYKMLSTGGLSFLSVLLPVALGFHILFALGLMMILAVITPFVRDVKEFVAIYLTISVYFSPATYLPEWVPRLIRPLLYLNPFSYVVWVYQDILFFGRIDHPFAWVVLPVMSVSIFVLGVAAFQKLKPFLGNVL